MSKYRAKPRWTKIEEQFLRDNYLLVTDFELAQKFKRTEKSVRRKRANMGLEKPEGRLCDLQSTASQQAMFGTLSEDSISRYREIMEWAGEFSLKNFGPFVRPRNCVPGADYVVFKFLLRGNKWLYVTAGPKREAYAILGDQKVVPPDGVSLLFWCRRLIETSLVKDLKEKE